MINFYNQVPTVYTSASRDFQYLSWLINIVLNSVKHNVDSMYELPNAKADPRLVELLAATLGFKIRRNYDQKQLIALVSIIPSILKYKGSKEAIEIAGRTLLKAAGAAKGEFSCKVVDNCLEVVMPKNLIDTVLFMDLLPYVLPAGLTCHIKREAHDTGTITPIKLSYTDSPLISWAPLAVYDENQKVTGLSTMFVPNTTIPQFGNFVIEQDNDQDNDKILNSGLLDNSMILAGEILPEETGAEYSVNQREGDNK